MAFGILRAIGTVAVKLRGRLHYDRRAGRTRMRAMRVDVFALGELGSGTGQAD